VADVAIHADDQRGALSAGTVLRAGRKRAEE
jgi:hypothetical protein